MEVAPVSWAGRKQLVEDPYKVADGLADHTMDLRRSWKKSFTTKLRIGGANLVVQTDGGLREGDCAAASFIIGLWGDDGSGARYEPLHSQGTYLDQSWTVFAVEAIALDEASAEVARILRQG
jgi:hypothetical protein